MSRLIDYQDAFGHEIFDYYQNRSGYEIIERNDGHIEVGAGPRAYFLEYKDWPAYEKEAMRRVQGRVLDIGCGAGRHTLYLQKTGHRVTALDNSPLAVKVTRLRGGRHVQLYSLMHIPTILRAYDTLLMMGNTFALLGSPARARWLLHHFHTITKEGGRIVGQTRDPYKTDQREHLEYHMLNRGRNRMPGQGKIRVRYKKYVGPWTDYLFMSPDELRRVIKGTPWRLTEIIDGPAGQYVAVLDGT